MTASLIVFSGIDGAGKSTQIETLRIRIGQRGERAVSVWSRGGYTRGMTWLKNLMRSLSGRRLVPAAGPSPARTQALSRPLTRRWWLRLAILDLIWLYAVHIRVQRWMGRKVICDRYWQDTLLDFQLNFPQESVHTWWMWKILERLSPRPDAAFLMLVPLEESLRRSRQKNEPFPDGEERLAERLRSYKKWTADQYWNVLDGRRSAEDIAEEVESIVLSP